MKSPYSPDAAHAKVRELKLVLIRVVRPDMRGCEVRSSLELALSHACLDGLNLRNARAIAILAGHRGPAPRTREDAISATAAALLEVRSFQSRMWRHARAARCYADRLTHRDAFIYGRTFRAQRAEEVRIRDLANMTQHQKIALRVASRGNEWIAA